MIYKSYLIEKNLDLLKNNLILFYGENFGLIKNFQENLKKKNRNIIKFYQADLLKNQDLLFNEVKNKSLFDDKKYIFISETNDKIYDLINSIKDEVSENKIYLFADILEKKSKLRSFFEKSNKCDVIPCYQDTKESLQNLIINELNNFDGINRVILNIFHESCGLDRVKINNEITKVKSYFTDKKIKQEELIELLNQRDDDDFALIRDTVLRGDKGPTNKLLSTTILENEKIAYYVYLLHLRLTKIEEIINLSSKMKLADVVNSIKPPIFWKDKPAYIDQLKMWNLKKIKTALKKNYNLEISIKTNSNINKDILIKKHLLDMCVIANS